MQEVWRQHKAQTDFLELCLRIAAEARGLEALPWETVYDGEEFLAAGAKTGMSRLPLDLVLPPAAPPLPLPLKMLAFISSPLDLQEHERLQIEREQEILLQAVNGPAGQGKLHLVFEDEAQLPILEEALSAGKKRPARITDLLHALQKSERTLQLAVLSGCQTARTLHASGFRDLGRSLAERKIPAVIAMQFSITDAAGLRFAESLYPKIVEGQMLAMSVSASRRALLHSDDPYLKADAFAPVLFLANNQCLQIDPCS